jgi:hypothetical protein
MDHHGHGHDRAGEHWHTVLRGIALPGLSVAFVR